METLPNCPRCVDEALIKAMGNLLVCGSCEATFVEEKNVNQWLPKPVEVLPEDLTLF